MQRETVEFAGPESGLFSATGEPVVEVTNLEANFRTTHGFSEDLAPAERKKIQQAIEQARLLEQQKKLEEMIAAEKEKDPDALEEDIRQQFFKSQATKRIESTKEMSSAQIQSFKQPAITLGTTL